MDMAAKRLASIAGHILARSERECGPDVKRMMSSASTVCGIGPSPMDSAKLASHQATVPKLPLPALDQTLARLVDVVRAQCSDSEVAEFESELVKFSADVGPSLHEELVAYDKNLPHSTFVTEFWNHSYFTGRYPVPINSNPFLKFRRPLRQLALTQADFGARYAYACARIFAALHGHTYGPVTEGGRPMCMLQYGNMLGACRIPAKDCDTLSTVTSRNTGFPQHVIVFYQGAAFRIKVMQAHYIPADPKAPVAFDIVPLHEIKRQFDTLLNSVIPPSPDVGVFTSLNRDKWASIRQKLVNASPVNVASLSAIESGLLAICLDDVVPPSAEDECKQFLFGPLCDGAPVNRWFDKFCVMADRRGVTGGNFEHSGFDGHAFKRLIEEAYFIPDGTDTGFPPVPPSLGDCAPAPPQHLPFVLTDELQADLIDARRDFDARRSNVTIHVSYCRDLSRQWLKECKVSPDGFIQAAFQLAHRRCQREVGEFVIRMPSVYESCSMRHFRDGRTETIRAVTLESRRFVEVYENPSSPVSDKRSALVASIAAHSKRSRDAQLGIGTDRHMFALACMAKRKAASGLPFPDLFATRAMQRLSNIDLSTSTIGGPATELIGFGPVSECGYGIGYLVEPDQLKFMISCFNMKSDGTPTKSCSKMFAKHLHACLSELKALIMT